MTSINLPFYGPEDRCICNDENFLETKSCFNCKTKFNAPILSSSERNNKCSFYEEKKVVNNGAVYNFNGKHCEFAARMCGVDTPLLCPGCVGKNLIVERHDDAQMGSWGGKFTVKHAQTPLPTANI